MFNYNPVSDPPAGVNDVSQYYILYVSVVAIMFRIVDFFITLRLCGQLLNGLLILSHLKSPKGSLILVL